MRHCALGKDTRALLTFAAAIVVLLMGVRDGVTADNSRPTNDAANVVRGVTVELQTPPATAEPAGIPAVRSAMPKRDDPTLVTQALARPQPKDQPAAVLGPDVALLQGAGTTRPWGMSASAWEAPAFCHRPLYFEDENLERHGHSFGLVQPAVSAAHFAGRTLAWPYLAGAFPPHECIYTLGRERPGSCAPYRLYRPPVSVRGAMYEGAAAAGLSFVVP